MLKQRERLTAEAVSGTDWVLALGGADTMEEHIVRHLQEMAPDAVWPTFTYHLTSNDSFFIAPTVDGMTLRSKNGNVETLSGEGAGIAATLFAIYDSTRPYRGSFHPTELPHDFMMINRKLYHRLYDFAAQHKDGRQIISLID